MRRALHLLALLAANLTTSAQSNNLLTYAGGAGNERFNDVLRWQCNTGAIAATRLMKE